MIVSGKARVAGVMGWPVAHSLSPRLHNFWLQEYDIDGVYVPMSVTAEAFPQGLRALALLGLIGANVTVPHKEAALATVDEATLEARSIGAVNTVVVRKNGTLLGSNTDGIGFMANVRDFVPGWTPKGKHIAILGAGGAAKAIAWTLNLGDAAGLRIVNRTPDRGRALVAALGKNAEAVPWAEQERALEGVAMLVNATTLGMKGQPPLGIDLSPLPGDAIVADIVYVPPDTDLLIRARARGNPTVDGIGMLLHQARPGFAAWFGREPEVTKVLRDFVLAGIG